MLGELLERDQLLVADVVPVLLCEQEREYPPLPYFIENDRAVLVLVEALLSDAAP